MVFFFNDTATTEIYTLSLHDALPIFPRRIPPCWPSVLDQRRRRVQATPISDPHDVWLRQRRTVASRSEEHTSELQSHHDLVCRLLLEKKNTTPPPKKYSLQQSQHILY